jgi:hypothetical protein
MRQLYRLSTQVILISFLLVACYEVNSPTGWTATPSELVSSPTITASLTEQSDALSTHVPTPTTSLPFSSTPSPTSTELTWRATSPQFATRLYFFSTEGYGFFDFSKAYPDNETILASSQQQTSIASPSSPDNLGDASTLAFSHFSEQIAYWLSYSDGTAELWIAGLNNQNPQLIFHDTLGNYGHQPTILWMPNDKHIILHSVETNQPDMIYSLATGQLQNWPWDCDRVALSAQSGQLALWCSSTNNTKDLAVIEWAGDIWFSKYPPESVLVKRHPNSLVSWEWSRDGSQIAYYDLLDETSALHIASSEGELLFKGLPGIAWYPEFDAWSFHPLYYHSRPLQWSLDGTRLLTYGNRVNNVINSTDISTLATEPTYQVVDVANGQILWSIEDSAIDLLRYENAERDIMEYSISTAVFAPDGNQVALQAASFAYGDRFLAFVDIDEGGATLLKSWFDSQIYWTREE